MKFLDAPGRQWREKHELKAFAKKMKHNPTPSESEFIGKLKAAGIKFKDQKRLGSFIADIMLPEYGIVVEIDGGYHDQIEQQQRDAWRGEKLTKFGLQIVRIRNEDVRNFDIGVMLAGCKKWSRDKYYRAMSRIGLSRVTDRRASCRAAITERECKYIRQIFSLETKLQITEQHILEYLKHKQEKKDANKLRHAPKSKPDISLFAPKISGNRIRKARYSSPEERENRLQQRRERRLGTNG